MARLAQLVERKALNLVVVGSSPTVGKHFFGGWEGWLNQAKICWREYAETRDRTGDLQIFSLTLSQLSYRGRLPSLAKQVASRVACF